MMDKTKKRNNRWKLFHKALALGSLLLLMGVMIHPLFGNGNMSAQADSHFLDVSLEQTTPEEGFLMIPGVAIPQDIKAEITNTTGRSYVYVKIVEKNNDNNYLLYELAEGWQQLQDLDGTPIPGVYYRYCDAEGTSSWPLLNNQQITVNPETVTWSFLERLSADATQATWPRLIYDAYGVALEYSDEQITPLEGWSIADGQIHYSPFSPSDDVIGTLAVPKGLSVDAYNVTLQDSSGVSLQPYESVTVSLPVGDAEAAIVLHVLDNSSKIIDAISAGKAVGLKTGADEITIVEKIDATVQNHFAVFEATSFSPYYVVKGNGTTLENWWADTQVKRYNFDSKVYGLNVNESGTREFVVEPDSTFYLYLNGTVTVNGQSSNGPVAGNWNVTSDNTDGRIMLATAGDGVGKVVSVSADATENDVLTFTANNWTVTIRVNSNVVENAYNNQNYPVYIGITLDATTISIGNEPRVSGYDTNAWVYVTGMSGGSVTVNGSSGAYAQHKTVAPLSGSVGATYLKEDITKVEMLENTDDKSVKGIIDNSLDTTVNGAIDITPYIQKIDWEAIKTVLLSDSSINSQLKATDGGSVNSTPQNYVLQPYVIKIQTSNFIGWHINACFVPVKSSDGWVYFDENLDASLGQEVEFLNVPARRPWNNGQGTTASMYYVNPKDPNGNYVKVSVTEYVTLTNGQKLRFMGWNTMPDGTGDMYAGEGGTFDAPNNSGNGNDEDDLVANGALYAFWDSTLDRLEIHKDLLIDKDQDASGRYKTDFTFTVKLTLPDGLEIDQDSKIIAEEFYVADDNLVANSQQNINLQGSQKDYTITFSFNEDAYGVIYAPKGTTYTVTETLPSSGGYTQISAQNTTGKIEGVGEGSIVRFVNGWNNTTGLLRVSKKIAEDSQTVEGWDTTDFPFTITLTAPTGVTDPTYTYRLYDRQNKPIGDPISTNKATITLNLSHNESVVFTGIKENTTYTVTEGTVEGSLFKPAQSVVEGHIVANTTKEAAFVNSLVETNGTLTIKKEFSGCRPEEGESFVFTVRDANGAEVAEIVIYGAGSKTIQVPSYGEYTVTEDDSWSWRYKTTRSQTVIVNDSTSNPTVTFTNTKSNPNWLDASAGVTNDFGSGNKAQHN